jgi:hypothetical protein
MKKLLLSTSALLMVLSVSAQLNTAKDGFILDNTKVSSNCYVDNLPTNAGIMAHGGNFEEGNAAGKYIISDSYELVTMGTLTVGTNPAWFVLPATTGSGETALCESLFANGDVGVDMSANAKVNIVAKSTNIGDTLEFFLGGAGQWTPGTSTYNNGSSQGIDAKLVFTKAGEYETFKLDFTTLPSTVGGVWADWTGKSKIQAIGFRSATTGTTFNVKQVGLGSDFDAVSTTKIASGPSVSIYPNPATDIVNIVVGSGNANVSLSSVTGAVVASATGSGTVSLNTSNVPAGLYVVSVSSATGVTTAKVVVK